MDVRCPTLIGREAELATLRERLGAARDGRGSMVFVSGEPGIGKSRLVQELTDLAGSGDGVVLTGRAVPAPSEVVYRPLAEVLAQALRDRDLPDEPEFAPWRPAVQAMLPTVGGPRSDGAEVGVHVCGEALVRVLRWVGGGRPLVVVLEDLHWADPDTLGVLEYLADNLVAEPVLCVGTLRDEPLTPALDLVRRLDQRGSAMHRSLGRLADHEVTEMVAACSPEAGAELMTRVRSTADGVPLLVEEVLATPGVPASVGEAVRTRVAALPEADRTVLYSAAVLGRDFDWELLPAIAEQPVERVTSALERMVAAMLVTVDGDGFRFRHALTREAVVAMLVPPRRAALARAALAALDEQDPDHRHAELALQAGDEQRAATLLTESGRAALRRGALGTAIQTLRRAAQLIADPTDGQTDLVEALALAGRFDEALEIGEQLLAQLGSGHPTTASVHLELARAAVSATRWPTAKTHLDAAKGLLAARPDPELAARVDVLNAEISLADDELDHAREAAVRALSAAESIDSPAVVCHALELIGRSHRVHDLDAARSAFSRAYRTAAEFELPVWRLRAQHELGTIELLDRGGTDVLLDARRTAEQLGAHSTVADVDVQLAAAFHLQFDLAAARDHARQAVAQAQRLNLTGTYAVAQFFDAATSALLGDRDATVAAAAEALRAAPGNSEIEGFVWAGVTGLLELLWGDRGAALEALDRGMTALHRVTSSAPAHYRGLWALLHAVERRPDAAGSIARVRASGATVMRANRGYLHYAEAVLAGSSAEVTAGDSDLALFPVWHHLGRLLLAEAARVDEWGSPEQWLRDARDCFDAYRLGHLARQCRRLLGEAPPAGAPHGAGHRRAPAGVTPRETEVLDLVAEGLANKQIAARLHLSVRTVEKHVESLLRKAGAQSRTQLIAMLGENT